MSNLSQFIVDRFLGLMGGDPQYQTELANKINSAGGAEVSSLNTLTGDIILAQGSGITITPSGNTLTIAGASSGANTTLSNLTSPVAFNQHLTPDADGTRDVGASTLALNNLWSYITRTTQLTGYSNDSGDFSVPVGSVTFDDTTSDINISNITSSSTNTIGLTAQSSNTNGNTVHSKHIIIKTGNAAGVTSNSGNLTLGTGTATGTKGSIITVADFAPSADTTYSCGSQSNRFLAGYFFTLNDNSGNQILNSGVRRLYATGGSTIAMNFATAGTVDFNGNLLSSVSEPASAQDAATKNYVDTTSHFDTYASTVVTTNSTTISSGTFTKFDNSPALTFTPLFTGTYKVYCNLPMEADTGSVILTRIVKSSGTGTLLQESQASLSVGAPVNTTATSPIESRYTLTAGASVTFDIQGKIASGTGVYAAGATAQFYIFAERCG